MLVDSDNYGFAYLLDDGQSYSYLIFVQETWSMLHENRDKRIIINNHLELKHFQEELDYVLNNIEGNNNMVRSLFQLLKNFRTRVKWSETK